MKYTNELQSLDWDERVPEYFYSNVNQAIYHIDWSVAAYSVQWSLWIGAFDLSSCTACYAVLVLFCCTQVLLKMVAHINGSGLDCVISRANVQEIPQYCTEPLIYHPGSTPEVGHNYWAPLFCCNFYLIKNRQHNCMFGNNSDQHPIKTFLCNNFWKMFVFWIQK